MLIFSTDFFCCRCRKLLRCDCRTFGRFFVSAYHFVFNVSEIYRRKKSVRMKNIFVCNSGVGLLKKMKKGLRRGVWITHSSALAKPFFHFFQNWDGLATYKLGIPKFQNLRNISEKLKTNWNAITKNLPKVRQSQRRSSLQRQQEKSLQNINMPWCYRHWRPPWLWQKISRKVLSQFFETERVYIIYRYYKWNQFFKVPTIRCT